MFQKYLYVVFGNKLNNQAFRIIGVAEIGGSPYARGHAHGKLADLQSVKTEVALAGVSYRRLVPVSIPVLPVFIARLVLVRRYRPVYGPFVS